MIVDSSALLAVLNREPDADHFQDAILTAAPCRMSVSNMLEASIVVESRGGAEAGHELDAFLSHAEIHAAPVTAEHLDAARQAWRRFGKGRHPASLNFGKLGGEVALHRPVPAARRADAHGYGPGERAILFGARGAEGHPRRQVSRRLEEGRCWIMFKPADTGDPLP